MATKQFSIRLEKDVKKEISEIADGEHRTLNGQVSKMLEEWLVSKYNWNPSLEEAIKGVEQGDVEPAYKGN